MPSFWLGLVALMVFSVGLGWFPLGFSVPIGVDAAQVSWAQKLHHLVLPALVLGVANAPSIALHTRQKTIDVLGSEYARFARSRGEKGAQVLLRHGLRNLLAVAREHDGAVDTGGMQVANRLLRIGLNGVCNHDVAGIGAID